MFEPQEEAPEPRTIARVPIRAVQAGVGALACLVLAWFAFVRGTRVPLLSLVDLGFHELGHMLTMWAPRVVYFAMGSVAQVAVPLALAAYFLWMVRDPIGAGVCLAWAGTSAQNVSLYIADAPYQRLPLLGGLHDWATILGPEHLDMLGAAGAIAAAVRVFGLLCLLTGFAVCCWTAAAAWTSSASVAGPAPAQDEQMWR
jgi:hypothetical protein